MQNTLVDTGYFLFSPFFDRLSAKQLVSGSGDKTVKLWDATKETCLKTFHGHTSDVGSLAVRFFVHLLA